MGCYDTITAKCPDCGSEISAQSKSGPCILAVFTSDDVPVCVAHDANRHAPFHCECGKKWQFEEELSFKRVQLKLILIK